MPKQRSHRRRSADQAATSVDKSSASSDAAPRTVRVSRATEADLTAFRDYLLGRPVTETTAQAYAEDVAHVHRECDGAVDAAALSHYFARDAGLRRRLRVKHAWTAWVAFRNECGDGAGDNQPPECRFNPRRIPRSINEPLTDAQYQVLLDAAWRLRPRTDGVLLGALTGLRARQLCKLRVQDIVAAQITADGSPTRCIRTSGKGGDEYLIPIVGGLADLLSGLCAGKRPDDYVLTRAGGTPWSYKMLNYWTHQLQDEVGVARLHPHALRRAFITWLERRGVPIQTISKLAGHANLNTTLLYTDPRGNPGAALGALGSLGSKMRNGMNENQ